MTTFSINDILLSKYMLWSANFKGLTFYEKMALPWWKQINSNLIWVQAHFTRNNWKHIRIVSLIPYFLASVWIFLSGIIFFIGTLKKSNLLNSHTWFHFAFKCICPHSTIIISYLSIFYLLYKLNNPCIYLNWITYNFLSNICRYL